MPEPARLRWHEDPEAFRDLVTLTAARTGFRVALVEKDYYCSVLLEYLAANCPVMIFKGGTCLAKVHTDFHRMSEDLDFAIPVSAGSARSARSRLAEELKQAMADLERRLPGLRTVTALRGANNSTQYNAAIAYTAQVGRQQETIKIEAGVREPLLTPAIRGEVRTLLLGPASDRPLVPVVPILCMSYNEAMAEKLRAALSRRCCARRTLRDSIWIAPSRSSPPSPTPSRAPDDHRHQQRRPTGPADLRRMSVRATQPCIARNDARLQCFGEHDIRRVVSS